MQPHIPRGVPATVVPATADVSDVPPQRAASAGAGHGARCRAGGRAGRAASRARRARAGAARSARAAARARRRAAAAAALP